MTRLLKSIIAALVTPIATILMAKLWWWILGWLTNLQGIDRLAGAIALTLVMLIAFLITLLEASL